MTSTRIENTRITRLGSLKALGSIAIVAIGLAGCAVQPVGAPSGSPAPAPTTTATVSNPSGTGESVSAKIDNAVGGEIVLSDGTHVDVPAGSLPEGVSEVTVTSSPAPAPSEYKAVSPVLVFGPDGTVFKKPLVVTMPVTVPDGMSTSDLTIMWSRLGADGFDMLPTTFEAVAGSSYNAVVEVSHFSRGFCGQKFTVDPHPRPDPYK